MSRSTKIAAVVTPTLLVLVFAVSLVSQARRDAAQQEDRQGERYFELEVQAAGADIDEVSMASVKLVAYGYCDAEPEEQVAAKQDLVNAMTNLGSSKPGVDADIVAKAAELHLCDD